MDILSDQSLLPVMDSNLARIFQITYVHSFSLFFSFHDAEVPELHQQVSLGHGYKISQTTDPFSKCTPYFWAWK